VSAELSTPSPAGASATRSSSRPSWLGLEDWTRLIAVGESRHYVAGDVIVAEGDAPAGLHVIADGFVRVERSAAAARITLARLGPGEAFGEMGLLEAAPASASVIADGPVSLDVIPQRQLDGLLASDTALASRVHRGLAVLLSNRLRTVNETLSRAVPSATDVEPPRRGGAPLTGLVTERQLPPELPYAVAGFRKALWEVEEARATADPGASQQAVTAACDRLLEALSAQLQDTVVTDASLNDLLAFRDPDDYADGIGAFLFREAFPHFMSSATIARCRARSWGYAADPETLDRILTDVADGDPPLGPLIDRWYLDRPTCRSRRDASARVAAAIRQAMTTQGDQPASILGLGARAPREVIDAARANSRAPLVTLLNADRRALVHADSLIAAHAIHSRPQLVHGDIALLASGLGTLALQPQHLVYAIDLADEIDDPTLARVMAWSHARLADGGTMLLSASLTTGPDRALQDHVAGWPVHGRTVDTLRRICASTPFGTDASVEIDASGVRAWVTAVRR
jgi:hypothetical protein